MVLTVEPGIYVSPGSRKVAKEFRGIGIRIEDDVAVTRSAPEVLTDALVRHPDDIEAFMAASRAPDPRRNRHA
jgi:Xaa-Pro aminopeptidase